MISATGSDAANTFPQMKEYIKTTITRYDPKKFKYSVIVFAQDATTEIKFDPDRSTKELIALVDRLSPKSGSISLANAIKHADQYYSSEPELSTDIKKAVVIIWDKNSTESAADITNAAEALNNKTVRLIPVPMIKDPVSAADAANPKKEQVVQNDVNSDPGQVSEEIVDRLLSGDS